MIYNYINFIINKPKRVLFFIFTALLISSLGLSNFKLDASSDALVLENDSSYKIYRESGDEFGNSDFLIVTYTPFDELFSSKSLSALKSLENELGNLKGVDNVFSLLDAPIFFQPKVPLTDVADNLKDLESPSINLLLAKEEFLNNPIYKELILSSDGKTTALQVVITSNTKKNTLINDRYSALDAIKLGGLTGQGMGEGILKESVPEAHTDYVIAVISEEYGSLITIIILIIFLYISFRIIKNCFNQENQFLKISLSGLATLLIFPYITLSTIF